jgi:hypothetical protein
MFTGDVSTMNSLVKSICGKHKDRVTVLTLDSSEMTKALCAADIGLLVRQDNRTNNAAFPNKFDEYLAAGLKVLTTPALDDIADIVAENEGIGLLVDYENIGRETERILSFAVRDFPITYAIFDSIQKMREPYSLDARLKTFADHLHALHS